MPSFSCPFVTADYLTEVRFGRVTCPDYEVIRLKPCDDPPNKVLLVEELLKVQGQIGCNFGLKITGPYPNKRWLIDLLATYKPGLYIFDKDYYPKDKKAPKLLGNDDNFFTGLPP
jgi:hypothetical protein